ncbi:MAG: gfo/Idh/MocA family oxidoreductase [Verrucomicrobia bacterium]|nr:MAG: gfo/Idh/MocA family oxidoreductase [Verrucomicrobiota bacterium]
MKQKVRYAVIGLGHIAQTAVLPAFAHAENSELVALVTRNPDKDRQLKGRHRVNVYSYDDLETAIDREKVDAVYIATPNSLHREHTERAARSGSHVLCEKPMAASERDCEAMIDVTEQNKVKLMIAYRLHFHDANLHAVEVARSGNLGDLRYFTSLFGIRVDGDNIRRGGTLFDIGIYCINAVRYLFRDEPVEVTSFTASNGEKRFSEVEEMASVILRFPQERLAIFTCSFGSAKIGYYSLVGTKGHLRLENAYEYRDDATCVVTIGGERTEKVFTPGDQFAAELIYFSDCILNDRTPEPSGSEGLADVRAINAIYESASTGRSIQVEPVCKNTRPEPEMQIKRPPVEKVAKV